MFTLSLQTVFTLGLLAFVLFTVGRWIFQKDTQIEDRRRHAIEAARQLSAVGLQEIPAVLTDYAVGDYSGLAYRVKELAKTLSDPKKVAVEFGEVIKRIVATPEGRSVVEAALAAQVK